MHGVSFIQDLAVVMIVAGVVTVLFHRLKQPVVLGYILAGLIIGPHTPPHPLIEDRKTIEILAELGVVFLLFSLGLHFSLRKLKQVGATAFIAALLEIMFMIGIGYGLGQAFGWSEMDSLFLGAILSISSTTIIIKALEELGCTRERFAELIFGILIVEDVLAIALLALLSGVAVTGSMHLVDVAVTFGELTVFLVAVLVSGLLLVPRLLRYVARFDSDEVLLITALGLCFGVSLLAVKLEYSVALGAFLIGAVIAEAREAGRIQRLIEPVRDLFSAIFFVAVGMLIDPATLLEHAGPILAITAAVVVGKVLTCSFGTLVAGNDLHTSMRVGMGLAQIGEFSFIIASLGQTLDVTSGFLYPIAVTVSAITTLLTPYLIRSADPLIARLERLVPRLFFDYLEFYRRSIGGMRGSGAGQPANRLLRRAGAQMLLNTVLMTGVFIVANWYARYQPADLPRLPDWMGGVQALVWLGAALLVLPLFVATFRKLQAAGLLLAEMRIGASSTLKNANAARVVIANTILLVGTVALCLWLLLVSSALLPPWPVLLVLLMIILGVMRLLWTPFVQLYTMAQVALRETFEEQPGHELEQVPSRTLLPRAFTDAQLENLEIQADMPAVGRRIRDLQLRTRTGATIIGLERAGSATVNPDPDEALLPGDRVLLLGNPTQIQASIDLLEKRASLDPSP